MRHGHSCLLEESAQLDVAGLDTSRLGCYFCNDVVAPQDVCTHVTQKLVRRIDSDPCIVFDHM
jgi:hypothetical protein